MKARLLGGLGVPLACGIALPLLGIALAGRDLAPYLEFPPRTRYVEHAPFSPAAFTLMAILIAAVVAPFAAASARRRAPSPPPARPFPWWGWAGLAAGLVSWALAWTRFPWMAPLQRHTFLPLWLSYIVVANALAFRRDGRCLLTHEPAYLARLFPVSAAFWWFFEYLNRFVQNWRYLGVEGWSAVEYLVLATLSFSTVLPAVMSTERLLAPAGAGDAIRAAPPPRRAWAVPALAAAAFGLAFVGIFPHLLFPLLWLAPLALFLAWDALAGRPTLLDAPDAVGRVTRLALAALVCGVFWETWNSCSLAKWVYGVPYVGWPKIFEMPLLGFAGYLPFGLECAVIADRFRKGGAARASAKAGP